MRVRRSHHRLLKGVLAVSACLGISAVIWAQGRGGGQPQTPPPNVSTDPLLRGFKFRSIGPATMMGRVDDIAGIGKGSDDHLRRIRHRRLVEVHRRRHSLAFRVRQHAERVDRRHRHCAVRTRTSSTSAPAKPTTARARRSATACGAPPTAARPGITWAWRTRSRSGALWWTRTIRTSSTWRRPATCSAQTRSAASTNPPTAARTGRRPSTSIRTPASPTWPSTRRIRRSCTRRRSSAGAPGGDTTAAAPAARCGRPPTAATPGPSWKVRAGPSRRMGFTAASRSPFSGRSPRSFTRRWKRARAVAWRRHRRRWTGAAGRRRTRRIRRR